MWVLVRPTDQQYNTIQYSTMQCNTVQYNTIQYNSLVHLIIVMFQFGGALRAGFPYVS